MIPPSLPYHVMVKPIGAQCNLRCAYCFYLEKDRLYPGKRAAEYRMSDDTLETFIRAHIAARVSGQREVQFAWQGGEPTLMGLPFFEKVVALQRKHAPNDVRITNTFQTNGVLLTDDFARFFRDHRFLIGISVDGPPHLHDRFRRDVNGLGTCEAVLAGIARLRQHDVEFNLLTVVHSDNSRYPEEVYDFLSHLGSPHIQFIPAVEPDAETIVSSRSVCGTQWGQFLNRVFHRWRRKDIGRIFVQHFDLMLGIVLGHPASLCVHAARCGRALALEHNGDLYSCDHFVDREHRLGNIMSDSLPALVDSPLQRAFGDTKSETLPDACQQCPYQKFCFGGCPKDRLLTTDSGRLNWLCEGYAAFYGETLPYFEAMAMALRQRQPASAYAQFLDARQGAAPHNRSNANHGHR